MSEKNGPNGFLVGLLIGGAVGALVSTKKGRQILKDIADYGLEYVGNTINLDDIETILNEEEEEMSPYGDKPPVKKSEEAPAPKVYAHKDIDIPRMTMERKEESPRRRLFRGIRKK